jgi:hypothetical protein
MADEEQQRRLTIADRRPMAAGASTARAPGRDAEHAALFSIVAPLFDLRDAGHRALESAVGQTFARDAYEVIAVFDAQARGLPEALLARCDRAIPVAIDADDVTSEIALYDAGARAARGDYLFFIEGHTVLVPDALRMLAEEIERAGRADIVCGRRIDHAQTPLGALIGGNNARHALRTGCTGQFTLGANCAIARARFEALGGFDPRYLRFNETVLHRRAVAAGAVVAVFDRVLCTHHNDAPLRWLVRLLLATGRAKSRYYRTLVAGARVRHPIYRWLGSRAGAAAAAIPLRLAGPMLIATAMLLARRAPTLAGGLYLLGVGCTDVAGFCSDRALAHARPAGAAGVARPSASSLPTDYELHA